MSKISYAALSLIGAVPGGYLSYLLVMAMLNHFSRMPGIMRIIVCLILALSAFVTVIPVGEKEDAEETKSESAADEREEADDEHPEETGEASAEDLPDLESAGVIASEESVMIEHDEELDDIYEAEDEKK